MEFGHLYVTRVIFPSVIIVAYTERGEAYDIKSKMDNRNKTDPLNSPRPYFILQ